MGTLGLRRAEVSDNNFPRLSCLCFMLLCSHRVSIGNETAHKQDNKEQYASPRYTRSLVLRH
jgi:hypothetical protein